MAADTKNTYKKPMILCPTVSDSCCTQMEQIMIFNKWDTAEKEQLIIEFIAAY